MATFKTNIDYSQQVWKPTFWMLKGDAEKFASQLQNEFNTKFYAVQGEPYDKSGNPDYCWGVTNVFFLERRRC